MTLTEKQAWEQVRARGRDRFILREGLLRHGFRFGVVFALLQIIFMLFRPTSKPLIVIVTLPVLAGVLYGALMGLQVWQAHESEFQKPTEDDDKG